MTEDKKESYLTHEYHNYVTNNNINSVILGGSVIGLLNTDVESWFPALLYILLFFYSCFLLIKNGVKISEIVEKSEEQS